MLNKVMIEALPPDDPADMAALQEAMEGVQLFLEGTPPDLDAWTESITARYPPLTTAEIFATVLLGLKRNFKAVNVGPHPANRQPLRKH